MKKIQLAYLAGLWDGEGSITVWKSYRDKEKKQLRIIPCMVFTNTNKEMIESVKKILDELGIVYYPHEYERAGCKKIYQLNCRNFSSVRDLIVAILPYLTAKQEQAFLTLQFVKGRLKRYKQKAQGWNKYAPYSQKEFEMCDRIMSLNKRGGKEKVQRL